MTRANYEDRRSDDLELGKHGPTRSAWLSLPTSIMGYLGTFVLESIY